MNVDLTRIIQWSIINRLTLNPGKSQSIIIYKYSIDTTTFSQIILNDTVIPFANTVRNLGLFINKSLTWDCHIRVICKRVYNILRVFWILSRFANSQIRRKLFLAYIFPHFLYGDVIMFGMSKYCERKLTLLFNAWVRYVHNLRKYDHISHVANSLLGCSLGSYYNFRAVVFLYILIKKRKPEYLFDKLKFARSVRTMNLIIPNNCCMHLNKSLFVAGVMLWNSLPTVIRNINVLASFRMKIMELLINKQ